MAWIYQRKDSGLWWIGTRANGKQILKSTGERDEAEARKKLATIEAMEAAQRAGRLNRGFFEALTGAHIEVLPLFESLDTWVAEATSPNTRRNYEQFAKKFKAAFKGNPALADITHEQVRAFLAGIRAETRASTANFAMRCAKAFFGRFKGALRKDPTEGIKPAKPDPNDVQRQAFTPEQIRSIVSIASPFWRSACALAFYTGLRLFNVATLKVGQVNLATGQLEVARTVKTGAKVCVKLPAGVVDMLREQIPPGARSDDFIWPDQAALAAKDVSFLSGQFATLLEQSGIRQKPSTAGNGRTGRRTVYALTFHSLRHSFISALANAGVNQQTVKQLVGHASDRINDAYTHLGQETLDKAAALLPDITTEVTK